MYFRTLFFEKDKLSSTNVQIDSALIQEALQKAHKMSCTFYDITEQYELDIERFDIF